MNPPSSFLVVVEAVSLNKPGEEKNLCELFEWLVCNKYFTEEVFDYPCWNIVSVPVQRSNNQIPLDLHIYL